MTYQYLKQLQALKKEVEYNRERLEMVKDHFLGSTKMDGMPHNVSATRTTENYATALADIQEILEQNITEYTQQCLEAEHFIASIDDSMIRQIVTMRYVEALQWDQIAAKIGGGNTADSVRMLCHRYLDSHLDNDDI